jgi:hypothetical protein
MLMALLVLNIVRKENTCRCSEPCAFRHLALENESTICFKMVRYIVRESPTTRWIHWHGESISLYPL